MAQKQVKYYFAYNSPYAFLANTRVEKEILPLGVELLYRPIYTPRSGGPPDFNAPRFRYMFEDVARFANAYGLTLNPGPFADTGQACRGFLFAQDKGKGRVYHDGVYRARWLDGKDISQEHVLAAIAEKSSLNRQEFLAALQDTRYVAALDQSNKEAEADGAFGIPFFVYKGEKFWGNDRLEWLIRAIQKG
jgi:2-hydroxychromene-2-carboxylate isomerase